MKKKKYMRMVTQPTAIIGGSLIGVKLTHGIAGSLPSSSSSVATRVLKGSGPAFTLMPMMGTAMISKSLIGELSSLEKKGKRRRKR